MPVRRAAAEIGHVNLNVDPDGVVRSVTLRIDGGGQSIRHLMELVSQAIEPGDINGSAEAKPLLIPYGRLAGHLPSISAGTVLAGEVPPELLQGRIIVVGATASGLARRYSMPMGTVMPGIKIQANILHGLLDKQMNAQTGNFASRTVAPL